MNLLRLTVIVCSSVFVFAADVAPADLTQQVNSVYPKVEQLYMDLHQHPELSLHETETAAKLASQLRALGYDVTTGVGGTGVVALLKNGAGPTVMLRTELDALPVEEKTGWPFASRVHTKDDSGADVPVMHACGHDIHMAALVGTATLLARDRQSWHGTLMLIGQPAEERANGASAMLKDGLFTRFPKPDIGFAMHDGNGLPAGKVGYAPGFSLTSADSVDIVIYGKGGHGAMPQNTIDPVVIAARTVVALQTIVSREISPQDAGVITVGTIHGGTKRNIIPESVKLELTVRAYKPEVRKHLLDAITRIARAESEAGNAPRPPDIKLVESTPAQYNDPKLTERIASDLRQRLGDANVEQTAPGTPSDDFAEFAAAGVPTAMFSLGAADPEKFTEAQKTGVPLPSNHSPFFAPDYNPTLHTAILSETTVMMELLR
jgi:hippurate hydrolase